jgi:hypothetical protein
MVGVGGCSARVRPDAWDFIRPDDGESEPFQRFGSSAKFSAKLLRTSTLAPSSSSFLAGPRAIRHRDFSASSWHGA